jgi:hypothetical protein
VATRAVAGNDWLVGARRRRQFASDIVVAFRTHRALITDQRALERARVRIMARQAITLSKRIVDASAGRFLHEFFMAFGAEA